MTAFSVKRGRIVGRNRRSNLDRFLEKVRVTESGCWEWLGWRDRDGYGMFNFRFPDDRLKDIRASHASLNLFCETELPLTEQACHHCDWRPCVHPEHLFIGSQADNVHDMMDKGRHMHGSLNYNAVLNETLVLEMRQRWMLGESIAFIARSAGIKESTAAAAIKRQNWNHI